MCQHGPKAKGRCRSPALRHWPLPNPPSPLEVEHWPKATAISTSSCAVQWCTREAMTNQVAETPFLRFPPFLRYFSHSFLRLFFFFLLHYLSSDPVTSDLLIQRETRGPFVYVHSANCTCKPVNNADERLKIFTMQSASSDEWPK